MKKNASPQPEFWLTVKQDTMALEWARVDSLGGALTRLETVFAVHCLCAGEFEPSDLYALREITFVGRLLLQFCTIGMIFGRK